VSIYGSNVYILEEYRIRKQKMMIFTDLITSLNAHSFHQRDIWNMKQCIITDNFEAPLKYKFN